MDTPDSQPSSRVRAATFRIASATVTHHGSRRVNADASFLDETSALFAVADGMGDLPTSAANAHAALAALAEVIPVRWAQLPPGERSTSEARDFLLTGLFLAHGRLLQTWVPRGRRRGTTVAAMIVCGESLVGAHVGDSRIHLLRARDGQLLRLTDDHTIAGEARQGGMRTEDALLLPDAHRLRQAVGASTRIEPGSFVRRWAPGDVAVLCTDGVSDHVGKEALASIVLDAPDLGEAAKRIVSRGVEGEGADNATVVLVHRGA
jgi:serine/threonine protein phosphatase PrpC